MTYVIGLDIGTSSTKALAVDREGKTLAVGQCKTVLHSPATGYQEQDPGEVLAAVTTAIRQVTGALGAPPVAVGCSSAMHSLILLDETGRPLTRAVTWADSRAGAIAGSLKDTDTGRNFYWHTGTPIHAMSPLCKVRWFREEEPALFGQVQRFSELKSFILEQLFRQSVIDYSLASATGLFCAPRKSWYTPALDWAGIPADQLPLPVSTHQTLLGLDEKHAREMDLPVDTPFITGAGDGCLANLGAGVLQPDQLVLTIGTSAALRVTTPEPVYAAEVQLFSYWLSEGYYVCGGPSNSGGGVLEWCRQQFFPDEPLEKLLGQALALSPAEADLWFLPWIFGERAPLWDASARGAFIGLGSHHRPAHLTRAVVEGILFNLYAIYEQLVPHLPAAISRIQASGGFTRSEGWVQLLADTFGLPVEVRQQEDSSALGAARMAWFGLDMTEPLLPFPIPEASAHLFQPDAEATEVYRERFRQWRRLAERLHPEEKRWPDKFSLF